MTPGTRPALSLVPDEPDQVPQAPRERQGVLLFVARVGHPPLHGDERISHLQHTLASLLRFRSGIVGGGLLFLPLPQRLVLIRFDGWA